MSLEPANLQFAVVDNQLPTIKLPILREKISHLKNLQSYNSKSSIHLVNRHDLLSDWNVEEENIILAEENENYHIISSIRYFTNSYCCGAMRKIDELNHPNHTGATNNHNFKDRTVTLQQVINFRVFLEITANGTTFMKLAFERYGYASKIDASESVQRFELLNDLQEVTHFSNGYHKVEFISSYLVHKQIDGGSNYKDLHIDWNSKDTYTITFPCQISDAKVLPLQLCKIVVYDSDLKGKNTIKMSSFVYLVNSMFTSNCILHIQSILIHNNLFC